MPQTPAPPNPLLAMVALNSPSLPSPEVLVGHFRATAEIDMDLNSVQAREKAIVFSLGKSKAGRRRFDVCTDSLVESRRPVCDGIVVAGCRRANEEATGRRFKTITKAHIVTSCRKFDTFGDWYLVRHLGLVRRIFTGRSCKDADDFYYDVKR